MYILTKKIEFPPVHLASEDGLLAVGGDLSLDRLELAYRSGIFPWYCEGEPIIWYSPKDRMVLFPEELRISKSMRKVLRNQRFKVTFNTAFDQVIYHCKTTYRPEQGGTWITDDMEDAYLDMHKKGLAKSVEVWENNELVGGLYGIDLGHVFCGESMFSTVSNASKVAFIYLVTQLKKENYKLIDCQVYNDHLASLGAREIARIDFLNYL
ncbi:MAG: leucyl/phenylalanyl-tRNA--protein transferase [Flavobacteriaceae bacterium]|nr:MAG: leucyl/phenylalanyl-tRNA--protein transferase [Flavobacteriaceae bacterium]